MVHIPSGDIDFCDIVAGVLQIISTIFAYNLRRLRISNVHRSNKRKWLKTHTHTHTKKTRSR